MKTDNSLRSICIAAIKRSYKRPCSFLLPRYFETETLSEVLNHTFKLPDTYQNELPIAQTIIDPSNWTLVTTRQIATCRNGVIKTMAGSEVKRCEWNDFKGYGKTVYTVGKLNTADGQSIEIFIETGRNSLVIIKAINTLVKLVKN